MKTLAIVIVAAGESARLGQAKQLVEYHGVSLIERQIQLALALTSHVYVVLGANKQAIKDNIAKLPVSVVENRDWQLGMGSSIASGVSAFNGAYEAVMILTSDQWRLTQSDLYQLVKVASENPESIVISQWSANNTKQLGPPTIFPKAFFTKLIGLSGEQGAKTVIQEYKKLLNPVNIANASYDLDTPEDLEKLNNSD